VSGHRKATVELAIDLDDEAMCHQDIEDRDCSRIHDDHDQSGRQRHLE
jgi:hypothetical protein